MNSKTLDELLHDREAKRPVALVSQLTENRQWLIYPDEPPPADLGPRLIAAARAALEADRCELVEDSGQSYFLQSFNPPLRMIIVGAVHIAQALAEMARLAAFDVIVVDPREAFATEARFPGIRLAKQWPDRALEDLALDRGSAVVTLSHDPKIDDPALASALASPAFYIGALGSRKTHRARLERLGARGFGDEDGQRIRGPVGLSIGSRTAAEIAVSILAQVIEARRGAGS